jgi:DtxR family Mn-dependent transcriptional regulator
MADPLFSLLIAALVAAISLLLWWPERGIYWCWHRARQMTERVLIEDALKHIQEAEVNDRCPTVESVAGALQTTVGEVADLLSKAGARNLLQIKGDSFCLTPQGRDYALQIIRAHRLWERYLADETGFAEDEWHEQAHRYEHLLSPAELDALSARLGNPTHDPHGDPIPSANGKMVPHGGRPLTEMGVDDLVRIVHLEDEPATLYAQLVAEGLRPGMSARVTEISPQRIRFWAGDDEHVLAPIVAANVSVVPLPQPQEAVEPLPTRRLAHLKPGEQAKVVSISLACRGNERRRLMDLGILSGTLIEAEMTSPSGDPTAYRVRGAVIALRREQADFINITPEKEAVQ